MEYNTFSWTVPDPENWHGFTFGIRTTEALEPTPPVAAIPEPETTPLECAWSAPIPGRRCSGAGVRDSHA
jgi:hypothetical protein